MKTLIIAGTAQPIATHYNNITTHSVYYKVMLYGQSEKHPLVQWFAAIDAELRSYDHLQDVAREKYAKYFNTDLFNIVSMDNLYLLDGIKKDAK